MNRPRVLVLSYSCLDTDPRVRRHIESLRTKYDVTAAGLSDPGMEGIGYLPVSRRISGPWRRAQFLRRIITREYTAAYWPHYGFDDKVVDDLAAAHPDLVFANDIETLPLSIRLKDRLGIPVVYDAHEFAPAQFADRFLWRMFFTPFYTNLCETFLPRVDVAFTVSPLIAREYYNRFGISFSVLMNAPRYRQLPVHDPGEVIRLVHHGGAIRSRKIENMIRAMHLLSRGYRLDAYLVPTPGNRGYLETLRRLAGRSSNVFIHEPLAYEQLLVASNLCDIGLYALPPANLNQRFALPNKLFEYIQARLAIVTGPSPEMAALVEQYQLGTVADDCSPGSIARAISRLTRERIRECRRNADAAARLLSAEREYEKLGAALEDLMPYRST